VASFVKSNIREYGMLLSLILIMAFFQFMTNGTLLKPLNLTNLILQNPTSSSWRSGMMLIIVAGHIDLSVGSVCGFVGAVAAVLIVQFHIDWILVTIFCLLWAPRSARFRATSSRSGRSRPSSSRWPGCWCSRASRSTS
jgi:putative multiple sugar transport system permease protein